MNSIYKYEYKEDHFLNMYTLKTCILPYTHILSAQAQPLELELQDIL